MSAQVAPAIYTPRKWTLSGLQGISDETLQVHFGLYEGYVKNTNLLSERIAAMRAEGKGQAPIPRSRNLSAGLDGSSMGCGFTNTISITSRARRLR